jgi:transcription elongation factor Elf1
MVEQPAVKTFLMKDKRKYTDRAEYLKAAVKKRRKIIRQQAIQYKGGQCQLCGYNKCIEALEFHHFLGEKNFGISQKGYTRSWEKIQKELEICVLLCANCHREVENGITQLSCESRIETRWDNGES